MLFIILKDNMSPLPTIILSWDSPDMKICSNIIDWNYFFSPTLINTAVAIIEAVPGAPAVPIVAIADVIIIKIYCCIAKSICSKLAVREDFMH